MLHDTTSRTLAGFSPRFQPGVLGRGPGDLRDGPSCRRMRSRALFTAPPPRRSYKAIQSTKIMAPPSNSISPIGEKAILHGIYKQIKGFSTRR